jgi:hypothetical protein
VTGISQAGLESLPPTVDIVTAARVLGCGRTLAYQLAQQGNFPCRVLRVGRRYLVVTADLLAVLGLSGDSGEQPTGEGTPRPRSWHDMAEGATL